VTAAWQLSRLMLDSATLAVFLPAVLVLAVVPGPDLALIVSHALARGARAGVWCSVGIALAGFLQTAVVAFGLGHLMQRMPVIADAVRFVGAAYLLWIGIGLPRKARRTGEMAPAAGFQFERQLRPRGVQHPRTCVCRPCASDGVPGGSCPLTRRRSLERADEIEGQANSTFDRFRSA
jgi:LysE type translocator